MFVMGWLVLLPNFGTPPVTYAWSDGQTGSVAINLCGDSIYTLTATDNDGCISQTFFTIPEDTCNSLVLGLQLLLNLYAGILQTEVSLLIHLLVVSPIYIGIIKNSF